jgi:hypothetical protein
MDVVTWALYRSDSRRELLREKRARVRGKDTAHATVRQAARLVGSDRGRSEPNGAGIAVHYALGMGPGALYAQQLFLANDELAAPLLRIAGPPGAYPLKTHVRGLVGHVVLGMATEAALNAVESDLTPR